MAYMRIQRSDSYNIFPTQDSRCRNVNIDQDGNINWTLTNDIYITFIIATNEMLSFVMEYGYHGNTKMYEVKLNSSTSELHLDGIITVTMSAVLCPYDKADMHNEHNNLTVSSYKQNKSCCKNQDSCCPSLTSQPIRVTKLQLCITTDSNMDDDILLYECVEKHDLPVTIPYVNSDDIFLLILYTEKNFIWIDTFDNGPDKVSHKGSLGCLEIDDDGLLNDILTPVFVITTSIFLGGCSVTCFYLTYKYLWLKRKNVTASLQANQNYYTTNNNFYERKFTEQSLVNHDYEEPYFAPASEEEQLIDQVRNLDIPEEVIDNNSLRLLDVLGSGAFGTVNKALLFSTQDNGEEKQGKEVAVKSLHGEVTKEERIKFLQEAVIMGQFNHPNIIKILGIVLEGSMSIIIEIMRNGDLRNHLMSMKPRHEEDVSMELPPTLLSYSRQIANGLVYLELKAFIHRDLAARNILVSDCGTCKIADFGLSRDLQDKNFYIHHGGKIPVKWTAPEALNYHRYSIASDVWSYGCVLYEIWSLAHKPFHNIENSEVITKLMTGYRLPPPPGCPRSIYEVLIKCWHPEPSERPSICDVTVCLQKPDFKLLQWNEKESSEKASITLGASLNAGHGLHLDLQKTYICNDECDRNGLSNMVEHTGQTKKTVQNIADQCNSNDHYYHCLEKPDITD